jgi:hypothetical protein
MMLPAASGQGKIEQKLNLVVINVLGLWMQAKIGGPRVSWRNGRKSLLCEGILLSFNDLAAGSTMGFEQLFHSAFFRFQRRKGLHAQGHEEGNVN